MPNKTVGSRSRSLPHLPQQLSRTSEEASTACSSTSAPFGGRSTSQLGGTSSWRSKLPSSPPRSPGQRLPQIYPSPFGRGPKFRSGGGAAPPSAPPAPPGGGPPGRGLDPGKASPDFLDPERLSRSKRTADLLVELARMRHEEVEYMGLQVGRLEPKAEEGSVLWRAFRTRAAELLAAVPLQHLDKARHTLLMLHGLDKQLEFDIWQESDVKPVTNSAEPTRWQCPTRSFEERVAQLAIKGASSLADLARCHAVTADLVPRGFLRPKVHEVIVARLTRWVEREPLQQVRRHAPLVLELAREEPGLIATVEARLLRRAARSFQRGELPGFARVLLELQATGIEILDGPGQPVLDHASAKCLPPMQVAILDAVRLAARDWPMERLGADFRGPVLDLGNSRPGVQAGVRECITARVEVELRAVRDAVLRRADPVRVQQELLHWGGFVLAVGAAGLLGLAEPVRIHMLGGPNVVGSLAFCAASCTPGAPELPPEYLGRLPALRKQLPELWQMVTKVFALLGDEEDMAAAKAILEEGRPAVQI